MRTLILWSALITALALTSTSGATIAASPIYAPYSCRTEAPLVCYSWWSSDGHGLTHAASPGAMKFGVAGFHPYQSKLFMVGYLKWSGWGRATTTGHGMDYPVGSRHGAHVTVYLAWRGTCGGVTYYATMRIIGGDFAAYFDRPPSLVWTLGCVKGDAFYEN